MEELVGSEIGFERDDGVEEAGLINNFVGEADGRGGVERGTGGEVAEGCETRGGRDESGFRRTGGAGLVGAESDVGEGHGF